MTAKIVLERLQQKGRQNWDSSNRASYMWAMKIITGKNSPTVEECTPNRRSTALDAGFNTSRRSTVYDYKILKDGLGMEALAPIKRPDEETPAFNIIKKAKLNTSAPCYDEFKKALAIDDDDVIPPAPSFGPIRETREIIREPVHRRSIAQRTATDVSITPEMIASRELQTAHRVVERLLKIGERKWDRANRDSFSWATKLISRSSVISEREPKKGPVAQVKPCSASNSSRNANVSTPTSLFYSSGSMKEVRGRVTDPIQRPVVRHDVSRKVDTPARVKVPIAPSPAKNITARELKSARRLMKNIPLKPRDTWSDKNKESYEWATNLIARYEKTQGSSSTDIKKQPIKYPKGQDNTCTVVSTGTHAVIREPIKRSNPQSDIPHVSKKAKSEMVSKPTTADAKEPNNVFINDSKLKSAYRLLELLNKKGEQNWNEENRLAFERATKIIAIYKTQPSSSVTVREGEAVQTLVKQDNSPKSTNGLTVKCDNSNVSNESQAKLSTLSSSADENSPIIMAIVDRGDIAGSITYNNWKILEIHLMNSLLIYCKANPGSPPTFKENGWHYGCIKLFTCNDQKSVNFLKTAVSNIGEIWPGAKLRVVPRGEICNRPRCCITIPSEPGNPSDIFHMIKLQNPNLPVSSWKVTKVEKPKAGTRSVSIVLDAISLIKLKQNGWTINYGYSNVNISLYKEYATVDLPNKYTPSLRDEEILDSKEADNSAEKSLCSENVRSETDVPITPKVNLKEENDELSLESEASRQALIEMDTSSTSDLDSKVETEQTSSKTMPFNKNDEMSRLEATLSKESEQPLKEDSEKLSAGLKDINRVEDADSSAAQPILESETEKNGGVDLNLGEEAKKPLNVEMDGLSTSETKENGGPHFATDEANSTVAIDEANVSLVDLSKISEKPIVSEESNVEQQDEVNQITEPDNAAPSLEDKIEQLSALSKSSEEKTEKHSELDDILESEEMLELLSLESQMVNETETGTSVALCSSSASDSKDGNNMECDEPSTGSVLKETNEPKIE